jgi:hypothetical protein
VQQRSSDGRWWTFLVPAPARPGLDQHAADTEPHPVVPRRVPGSLPWVWKDPQTCLTADLWLPLVQAPPAIVLVARDPLRIARSVNARD